MHRIKLECAQYADNSFLTLTYVDECLPEGGTLVPEHLQSFMHRVRTRVRRSKAFMQDGKPRIIRFFAVGEYGDQSWRPHYHVALFNYPGCSRGGTRKPPKYTSCCPQCDLIAELWPHGLIQNDTMSDALSAYIGGYITKKLTKKGDLLLEGRYPEFARMSNRPGIGAGAMHEVADVLLRYYDVASELGDVPVALAHGRSRLPLGRYLRRDLRKKVGMKPDAPQCSLDKAAEELLDVRMAARASSENPSIKGQLIERDKGKIARIVTRHKIFKQRKKL